MRQFVFSDTFCFRQFKSAYIQKKNNFAITGKGFEVPGMNCKPAKLCRHKFMGLSLIFKKSSS